MDATTCPARTGEAQVTLTASAVTVGPLAWPDVQVAFVIETTLYDGVYDQRNGDSGFDTCAWSNGLPCEESNGVPFFVSHAQQIADAIRLANPHSNVSFALVDYYATLTDHDDDDGLEYHVDLPQFIGPGAFGPAVQSTFQATQLGGGWSYGDSDFSDNILDSSMITALYGTIIGSGLDWSPNSHHVIVWMGSTAPRDPNYVEDYSVSPSDDNFGYSAPCEPGYSFGAVQSPYCVGWIRSQDGNRTHSIAQLARTSPTCTDSVGHVCTVDMIDLYTTPTDPDSADWPCTPAVQEMGGCPGGVAVRGNVAHVLLAGCDMAAATGGSWDGPDFFECPQGMIGHLQPAFYGTNWSNPDLVNPKLFDALRAVGFGPVVQSEVANGADRPIFQFVPFGGFRPVPDQTIMPSCHLPNGLPFRHCGEATSIAEVGAVSILSWNWSDQPAYNHIQLGDSWTVTLLVYDNGPPYGPVPVDASTVLSCRPSGDGPVNGLYTWASYLPPSNDTLVTESFPCALVNVEAIPGVAPPPTLLPPGPSIPVQSGVPVAPPTPLLTGVGIAAPVAAGLVSLQAVAAGFLGAGFLRITMRGRPIANPIQVARRRRRGAEQPHPVVRRSYAVGRFD